MRSQNTGMTLLEVLVALSIFSLIATAGYSGLQQGLSVHDSLQQKRQFWRQLDSVLTLIQQDLDQARDLAPRIPALDAVAFRGAGEAGAGQQGELIVFTRGGNISLRDGPVSPYQRIAYHLREGTLYRTSWPRLNMPLGEQGTEAEILTEVTGLQLRYLDNNHQWLSGWSLAVNREERAGLPRAVELTLELEDRPAYQRVFHVSAPY